MAESVEISSGVRAADDDLLPERLADEHQRERLPPGVEAFQINGPLFFGAANRLDSLLDQFLDPPKVFILRMRLVPIIDASGVHALENLARRCARNGIVLVVSGLQQQPNRVLADMDFGKMHAQVRFVSNYERALRLAASLVETATHPPPAAGAE